MDKRDKGLFHTYANDVGAIATQIAEVAVTTKDKEWKRLLDTWSNDLHFVTEDIRDTLDRL